MFGRQIRVTLIDADTGEPIGETSHAPAELPESFEGYTTLKVGEHTWEVLGADPSDRREYLRTGTLRLQIRKVEITTIPITELMYSLPTVNRCLPDLNEEESKLGLQILEIIEDDWRQIELWSVESLPDIRTDIDQIAAIVKQSKNGFFKTLVGRTDTRQPLEHCRLLLPNLLAELDGSTQFDGLGFRNAAGLIPDAFALRTQDGLYLYGLHDNGRVTTLCLLRGRTPEPPEVDSDTIAGIMRTNNLHLIDWCHAAVVTADEASEYISTRVAFQIS